WSAAWQGAHAVTTAYQTEAVEDLVGAGRVVLGVQEGVLVTRVVGVPRRRDRLADLAETEEGRLADLLALDADGERDAEVTVGEQLTQFGVGGVLLVDPQRGVVATEGRPGDDAVARAVAVLDEDRVVGELDVAVLHVELAGDGREVQRFDVGEEAELHFV